MPRCYPWLPRFLLVTRHSSLVTALFAGLLLGGLSTCKGPVGPPGLLKNGKVAGQITVWEDAVTNSRNAPAAITAGGFSVALVGDSTKTTTTGPDGKYEFSSVPAGTYVVVTSKDSASAAGYGTMRRYNFVVGGGTSFHSEEIGRLSPKPDVVSVSVDSLPANGGKAAVVKVAWRITPVSLQFSRYQYLTTFFQRGTGAIVGTVSVLGSGALTDTLFVGGPEFVGGLPPGEYNVSVESDIGLFYVDQSTGQAVFPTRSRPTFAPNTVVLTRPTRPLASISTRALAREWPGKRVLPVGKKR